MYNLKHPTPIQPLNMLWFWNTPCGQPQCPSIALLMPLAHLPPSIINLHVLPFVRNWVWNKVHRSPSSTTMQVSSCTFLSCTFNPLNGAVSSASVSVDTTVVGATKTVLTTIFFSGKYSRVLLPCCPSPSKPLPCPSWMMRTSLPWIQPQLHYLLYIWSRNGRKPKGHDYVTYKKVSTWPLAQEKFETMSA